MVLYPVTSTTPPPTDPQVLRDAGCDVNAPRRLDDATPLHLAVQPHPHTVVPMQRRLDAIRVLLLSGAGASLTALDHNGQRPIKRAKLCPDPRVNGLLEAEEMSRRDHGFKRCLEEDRYVQPASKEARREGLEGEDDSDDDDDDDNDDDDDEDD